MELWLVFAGFLAGVLIPLGGLAISNTRKWKRIVDASGPVVGSVTFAAICIGFGAFMERTLAKHEVDIVAPALGVAILGLLLLATIGIAEWLRKP